METGDRGETNQSNQRNQSYQSVRIIQFITYNLNFAIAGVVVAILTETSILSLCLSLVILVCSLFYFFKHMQTYNGVSENPSLVASTLNNLVALILRLLPESRKLKLSPDFSLKAPHTLHRRNLHLILITLTLLLTALMFFVQLTDVIKNPSRLNDPDGTYTRDNISYYEPITLPTGVRLAILICSPITMLLCIPLYLFTLRPSILNLLLSSLLTIPMAIFYCYLSAITKYRMNLMNLPASSTTFLLRYSLSLTSPLLASLLLSLSLSYVTNIIQKKENAMKTSISQLSRACVTMMTIHEAMSSAVTVVMTGAALVFTNNAYRRLMIRIGDWSSPDGWKYSDINLETNLQIFSMTQLVLSVILLTFYWFLLLTRYNKTVSGGIWSILGLALITASISTLTLYFTNIYNNIILHHLLDDLRYLVFSYYYIGSQIILGVLLGLGCLVAGWRFLVSLLSFLLRLPLSILAICFLIPVTLAGAGIHLVTKCLGNWISKTEVYRKKVEEVGKTDSPQMTTDNTDQQETA